ncbi:MAG: 2-oxoacid:ferredoxin oxidoreductase subunit beta [Bryobacteraceae bacterium]|nr:2-oxoacid:ferredoxin oxidoreductase subunit beta [Solibacteraceae bacterium]MCO5352198.1 2-oxoacid:ferredoxin oxidoreductase subunit beta [Bryobacteraceae bacterium]
MSTAPVKKLNPLGFEILDYRGGKSTLCAGCGHNAITERLIEAAWAMGVEPWRVAKVSGIGCSSKTPAYFLGQSHGFNALHGRAPAVATGALLANHSLRCVVVSGDGDTASIGMGQYIHMLRRNPPLTYIIENNGVYGLTKGQFSATADRGSTLKNGTPNELAPIDCCQLALELGATFVARSFSGDKRQLSAILKACLGHNGLAVVDVISPCTTFNDHSGSTKSYAYMRDHEEPIHDIDFIPHYEDIAIEYEEGAAREVTLHDGSRMVLRKLKRDYDPHDRLHALQALYAAAEANEVLTGVLYAETGRPNLAQSLKLVPEPLATLPEAQTRPSPAALEAVMEEFR